MKIDGKPVKVEKVNGLGPHAYERRKQQRKKLHDKIVKSINRKAAIKKIMQKNYLVNQEKREKIKKSRYRTMPSKKVLRAKTGEVLKIVRNKAAKSQKLIRKPLSGSKARRAMVRRSRK